MWPAMQSAKDFYIVCFLSLVNTTCCKSKCTRHPRSLVAVMQNRSDNLVHFELGSVTDKTTVMTSVWQVQLCEFVTGILLTQSWTGSKCLVCR